MDERFHHAGSQPHKVDAFASRPPPTGWPRSRCARPSLDSATAPSSRARASSFLTADRRAGRIVRSKAVCRASSGSPHRRPSPFPTMTETACSAASATSRELLRRIAVHRDGRNPAALRVNGTAATLSRDDPVLAEFQGGQLLVRVRAQAIFPNCPRYIPGEDGPSLHAPRLASRRSNRYGRGFDSFRDVVPPRRCCQPQPGMTTPAGGLRPRGETIVDERAGRR